MNIKELMYKFTLNLKNLPGPTVNRKIVVIECDDYGGIRMPSLDIYKHLVDAGIGSLNNRYDLYDTMEDKEDLEMLFDTLQSVKDKNGHPAVMSPFVNVANPDFEKIEASNFTQYFYEPFTETLQRYKRSSDTFKVWKQGMNAGIFAPEFHGREHVSVQPWMQKLKEGHPLLQVAFKNGFISVTGIKGVHDYAQGFRPEFYFTQESNKPFLHQSIKEGVQLFEQIFGYIPFAFMPSNSVFHTDFEKSVFESGISFLCVAHRNLTPLENGNIAFTRYTFKQKIKTGKLNYYIRNCAFEPNDHSYSGINKTLSQVEAAFRLKKPAIISTHRVNFSGGLNKQNRGKGLMELKFLLQGILKKWPETEFLSTAQMLKELKN